MPRIATERVTRGLQWIGLGLLIAGALVIVAGIGFTRSIDALLTASAIAVLAFGLPGAAAFGLAFWVAHVAERMENRAVAALRPLAPPPRHAFREPVRRYAIACAAVLGAWGARAGLDVYIPDQVPFITFYLAVAVTGWVGGFGPAVFATLLSLVVSAYFYVKPDLASSSPDLGRFVLLGLFVLVCLGIAALMATLHEALARTQQLTAQARRITEQQASTDNRLRALSQGAPVALFIADSMQSCTYCNPAWLALRGRTLTQELGNGWWDGVHPEDLARRRDAFARAMHDLVPGTVDYRLRHADGEFRRVRDLVAVHSNAKGYAIGLLGACIPLSDAPVDVAAAASPVEAGPS